MKFQTDNDFELRRLQPLFPDEQQGGKKMMPEPAGQCSFRFGLMGGFILTPRVTVLKSHQTA